MANLEHNNEHFVIQKGRAICDKGTSFPNFKVTSHQKHYWNSNEDTDDYLAVTEDDLQFNPISVPFGNCSVKNGQPCSFAPIGKWTNPYEKVKVMDKSCLTEISELQCTVGGKIKVLKHGQTAEISKQNFKNADAEVLQHINPFFDFREFLDDLEMGEVSDLESEKTSTDTEKKINKVNLFMVDDTSINENTILKYNQTIKVKVYTQNLPKELLKLSLYEEDFNGDGESKKVAETTKSTNEKGFLWYEFKLETDFKNIANAMMNGINDNLHEYYVTVQSITYPKKKTAKNIQIIKPNFLNVQNENNIQKSEKIEETVIEEVNVKGKYKRQIGFDPMPKTGRSVSIVQENVVQLQISTIETFCIVNVRPQLEWKGEFGFDWYQTGNANLGDTLDFSKIIGKYYDSNDGMMLSKLKDDASSSFKKYYFKNCNKWYSYTPDGDGKYDLVHNFKNDPQYKEQDDTLEKLQDKYTAFKYKRNLDDKETKNCYAGYLSLFPSDWPTDVPKEAELKLYFDFLTGKKPDEIFFEINDKPLDANSAFQISPASILNPEATADITVSSVERYKYAAFGEDFIAIKIKARNKDNNTTYDVGEIRVLNPRKAKTQKILEMGVKTVSEKFGILDPAVKTFTKKILNQCLIDPEFLELSGKKDETGKPLKFEIDLSSKDINANRKLHARKIGADWQINDSENNLGSMLLESFTKNYPAYRSGEYFRLYVMDVNSLSGDSIEGGYSNLGYNFCVFFKSADKSTLSHELLHGLKLNHTFCSNADFSFKALSTHNIMDYSDMTNDPVETVTNFNKGTPDAEKIFKPIEQYQLWFWQWLIASKTNFKV